MPQHDSWFGVGFNYVAVHVPFFIFQSTTFNTRTYRNALSRAKTRALNRRVATPLFVLLFFSAFSLSAAEAPLEGEGAAAAAPEAAAQEEAAPAEAGDVGSWLFK